MSFRKHQEELKEFLEDAIRRRKRLPPFLGCHVCCGGGKQALAGIASSLLIEKGNLFDKVCWVAPNGTLCAQAEESLGRTEWLNQILPHNLELYHSVNNLNPSKGGSGYTITYNALRCDSGGINRQEFERYRYLLILDEPHHAAVGSPTHKALEPLVERAGLVMLMTGTVDRSDKQKVYLLPYTAEGVVNTRSTPEFKWINYSFVDGMREKALIRVNFELVNGRARWMKGGEEKEAEEFGDDREALFAALNTEYAFELLDSTVSHWSAYRKRVPWSKLLVVCANVGQAQSMKNHLERKGWAGVAVATYKDEDADTVILQFKRGSEINILITVNKAYEGLDVPAITHLCCLTHIRSRPWIEQMLARVWRYNRKGGTWDTQLGYVWAPDDSEFNTCIAHIREGQQQAVREMEEEEDPEGGTGGGEPRGGEEGGILPLDSDTTSKILVELVGGGTMTAEEASVLLEVGKKYGLDDPFMIRGLQRDLQGVQACPTPTPTREPLRELTPRERLATEKGYLDQLIGRAAQKSGGNDSALVGERKRDINAEVKRQFGLREALGLEETRKAVRFVKKAYNVG